VAPTAAIAAGKLVKGRLALSGRAADTGCATSAVRAVDVVISTRAGRLCRLVRANGTLSKPLACAATPPASLVAHGTRAWSLKLAGRLAKGTYSAYVRAIDKAGNAQKVAKRLTLKVR
jgi:hypothetical protein